MHFQVIIILLFILHDNLAIGTLSLSQDLNELSVVTNNELFPYMAAILKKTSYISAGALIDENWIITGADSLYMLRDFSRILRVRLGSINYKKGGIISPVKFVYIHPLFDDNKPQFDLALIKLSQPMRFTPSLNPIKLLTKKRDVTTSHFVMTSWLLPSQHKNIHQNLESMEILNRRRLLTISHVHPTNQEECSEQLDVQSINNTGGLMCLDPPLGGDSCQRDIGAPVVLNGVLWGIISSWRSEDCDVEAGTTFVTLVSHVDVSSWIHATIHGHRVTKKHTIDYDDNFI